MHFINKPLHTLLAFTILLGLSIQASAGYITSKVNDGVVYSLFSAPNKILRYNMAGEANLESISLDKIPTAFTVANGIAYVGFHRELRAINLTSGSDQFIRNTSTDIVDINLLGGTIFAAEGNGTLTSIRASDFQLVESKGLFYPANTYVASETQSALYYRSMGISPSDINKLTIASDGTMGSGFDSPYHGSYPSADKLFINASQNKIYDDAGIIYFADTLSYAGSLGGSLDSIAFIDNNPIVLRGNILKLFTAESIEQGELTLPVTPTFIASYAQKIFSFSFSSNSDASTLISDLSSFKLPALGQAVNPIGLNYTPEFYEHDEAGNIYAIDRETLSVFRWSTTQNAYLDTWPLAKPPTWATYSAAHKRLYLGYADGKITYFLPAESAPIERHFATLATGVAGLLAAGNYLFAADHSGAWSSQYSLNSSGIILSSAEWKNTGAQYIWNSVTNRVYHMRDSTSPNDIEWTEINPTTGALGSEGDSPYHGDTLIVSYPLIVSDDGQYIANGAGQILDAISLNVINSLSNSIADGVWINGNLATISKAPFAIQFWNKNFEKISTLNLNNISSARLLNINGKLLLIQQQSNGPSFGMVDLDKLPDTDSDSINDFVDNCITISNTDQADFDKDRQGNACDSDDDDDGIPDSYETSNGLNPLNAADASEDSDKDGFSNAIEYLLNTAFDNPNSIPSAISNYAEGFENGWPAGFFNSKGATPWTVQSGGRSGSYSLKSTYSSETSSASEVNFTGFFNPGIFSLNYKANIDQSYNYSYSLSLLVDGVTVATGLSYQTSWDTLSVNLNKGVHTITLRAASTYTSSYSQATTFSVDDIKFQPDPNNTDADLDDIGSRYDNCPSVANPNQADIDLDGTGDACDPFDNRPKDTDSDGIYDSGDNCPLLANPQQQDMDWDSSGDACDTDIDGDGVSNAVEKTFSFMNERDATDVTKDQDGDGVTNGYEIASSTRPDVADDFPSISLFEYFPLGEINSTYSYFTGYETLYFTDNMKRSSQPNTYTVTSSYSSIDTDASQSTYQIERKDTGVYLTQSKNYYGSYDFSNHMIIPASLKLGGSVTNKSTVTPREAGSTEVENMTTKFELIKTGQTLWKGTSYPSITIKRTVTSIYPEGGTYEDSVEITYLKGLGAVTFGLYEYDSIDIISLDAPAQSETAPKKKSGGGAVDVWLLAFLVLGSVIGNRKRIFNSVPVTLAHPAN